MNIDHYQTIENKRITLYFTDADKDVAQSCLDDLLQALVHLSLYFNPKKALPRVRAFLAEDRNTYDRLVTEILEVPISTPSHPARIAQPQRTDMVFLAPSAYEEHSKYEFRPDEFTRTIFHEMTHVIEEFIAPDMEVTPMWWSEGLAALLSGQWRIDDQFGFRQPVIQGIATGEIPTLDRIAESMELGYDWGWTVVGFIEKEYGKSRILKIVYNCDDGDIFRFIGNKDRFEAKWRKWLGKRGIMKL